MDLQRLVDAYIIGLGDNADNTEFREALVSRITNGDISLLELVQALGQYLASEEANRRSKGLHVLSDVLNDLPETAIPSQAISRLVQFFSARLSDATCVPQVLTAINALLRLPTFTDEFTADVLNALFKEVHVQSFQYSTRSAAYQLIELAMANNPRAVQQMGDAFVLGFAQLLDGEKDPRSLIVAFQIVPKIAALVDIRNNAEDLFEVVFCYFPITFKHRDGDPSAISPESLKNALRAAITCSPHFGKMAVKPLVNKTTATATSAKIDALETLAAGTHHFSADAFKSELEVLVEQIREDVVMSADEKVVSAALETLEAVYAVISPSAPAASEITEIGESSSPLDYVLKEAMFQLTGDGVKSPEQIGKILRSVARSSAYNCSVVSDAVLPIIIERLESADVLTVRRELMDVLNYVLSASCDVEKKAECLDAEKTNLLNIYRPDTSIPLDKEYSFLHIVRLKGITLLTLLPGFLNENETAVALQTLGRAAIERNEDENINKEGTHLLIQLSQSNSGQIQTVVLPMFFAALRGNMVAAHKVSRLLNALGALGVSAPKVLTPVLAGLVALIVSGDLAPPHCLAATSTIRKMVETVVVSKDSPDLCPELIGLVVRPLSDWVYGLAEKTVAADEHALSLLVLEIARTTVSVFSKLEVATQEQYLVDLFARYQAAALQTGSSPATLALCRLLPLFSAAICSCWPQTKLPIDNLGAFLESLAAACLATDSITQRDAGFEIIASVINKTGDVKSRGELTQVILRQAELSDLNSQSVSPVLLRHWMARALVSCNDKNGYDCVHWLLDLISRSSVHSVTAAEGFSIILGEHDWSVTTATHAVFRILSKQRFYATVVPSITAKFQSTTDDQVKTNLLVALTNAVKHMPKSVLMNGIESIVPLLLSAIRLTAGSLKAASIRTITMVILESPDTLQNWLAADIVPLLVASMAQDDPANTVEVRRAANDALSLVPEKYQYPVVHTVRKAVLRALAAARDDRKRLVRQDATKAYNKWLSLGES